ncbi:MAG: hypothetical protein H6807_15405 [Planctomycetes bacterium]|nr:hypothetical protein [Planctomycetota bacterium]
MRLIVISCLLTMFMGSASGQTPQLPSWIADPMVFSTDSIHPALGAVSNPWDTVRIRNENFAYAETRDWRVRYHGLHGDVVCQHLDSASSEYMVDAVFATGTVFDYVLDCKRVECSTDQFLVIGQKAGAAVVRIGTYDLSSSPPVATLGQPILVGNVAGVPIAGDLVGGTLYVFDGLFGAVSAYVDVNGDGVPDSPSAIQPAEATVVAGSIWSFSADTSGQIRMQATTRLGPLTEWLLSVIGGAFVFSADTGNVVAERPSIVCRGLMAGQRAFSFAYLEGEMVRVAVTRNGNKYYATGPIKSNALTLPTNTMLSQALAVGDVVTVEDASDSSVVSDAMTVDSVVRPLLLPIQDSSVIPGSTIRLLGENIGGAQAMVAVKIDGVVVGSAVFTKVSPRRIDLVVPDLPPGSSAGLLAIEVYDSTLSPQVTRAYTQILIL